MQVISKQRHFYVNQNEVPRTTSHTQAVETFNYHVKFNTFRTNQHVFLMPLPSSKRKNSIYNVPKCVHESVVISQAVTLNYV